MSKSNGPVGFSAPRDADYTNWVTMNAAAQRKIAPYLPKQKPMAPAKDWSKHEK